MADYEIFESLEGKRKKKFLVRPLFHSTKDRKDFLHFAKRFFKCREDQIDGVVAYLYKGELYWSEPNEEAEYVQALTYDKDGLYWR